jgi:hypothetical protein
LNPLQGVFTPSNPLLFAVAFVEFLLIPLLGSVAIVEFLFIPPKEKTFLLSRQVLVEF